MGVGQKGRDCMKPFMGHLPWLKEGYSFFILSLNDIWNLYINNFFPCGSAASVGMQCWNVSNSGAYSYRPRPLLVGVDQFWIPKLACLDQIWSTKIGLAGPVLVSKIGPAGPFLPRLIFL